MGSANTGPAQDGERNTTPKQDEAAERWLLNEFTALRQEFIERFRTENLLVLGALTFLSTILSLALKDAGQINLYVLLVVPIVMPLIGTFYINQRLSNTAIGLYLKDSLAPRASALLRTQVLQWEDHVRKNTTRTKELTLFIFILLVFASPSFAALALTYQLPSIPLFQSAWWTGVVISSAWTILWLAKFWSWSGKRKRH